MVNNYLCDQRWQEVFLLLARLSKADELLLAMEQRIHSLMDTPKLQNLLIWVERITDETEGDVQPVGKRAITLANAYANTETNALSLALAKAEANAFALALALAKAEAGTNANAFALALAFDLPLSTTLNVFIENTRFLEEFQVYQKVNYSLLINKLEEFKQQIPDKNESNQVLKAYRDLMIQTWLEAFHLTKEMVDLSREEIKALDNYFYANLLMVKCKKAAVSVSRKTWSEIESRMLLPVRDEQ